MALGLAVRAFTKVAGHLWNKPLTWGSTAALASIPVATAVLDHETDGALSYAAFKTLVNELKDQVKNGASPQDIEKAMDVAGYISDVSKTFRKGAQSVYVEQRMQQKDGADAILAGKRAAVEFQLLPDNVMSLAAKQVVRTGIADDLFKGDRNAADKYLANSLINDIVKGAQVIPLKDNQVSRDDVKAALVEIINKPDKHPVASKFFGEQDRLMNGLRQIWPELSGSQAQMEMKTEAKRKEEKGLRDSFGIAADGEGLMMKIFAFFIAMMMQMLGLGKNDGPENEVKKPSLAPAPRPGF